MKLSCAKEIIDNAYGATAALGCLASTVAMYAAVGANFDEEDAADLAKIRRRCENMMSRIRTKAEKSLDRQIEGTVIGEADGAELIAP